MQITVLGKSPSWQDAAGACSGYLVQEGDFTLLLDCGNGVFSKLRRLVRLRRRRRGADQPHARRPLPRPGAVQLRALLRAAPAAGSGGGYPGTDNPARPELYAPSGATEVFRKIVGCWGPDDLIDNAFDLHEYEATDELTIGPLRVRFCEVPHYTVTYAVELSSNGSRFTFSADCSPNEELVQFARDTDMLLIEATLPRPERTGIRGHLTPGEAGEHGRDASARRLIITHYSDELDPEWAREEAVRSLRRAGRAGARGRGLHRLGAAGRRRRGRVPRVRSGRGVGCARRVPLWPGAAGARSAGPHRPGAAGACARARSTASRRGRPSRLSSARPISPWGRPPESRS